MLKPPPYMLKNTEFVGFYDADGSVYVNIVNRRKKCINPNILYGFDIRFEWSQSTKNVETLNRLNATLGMRRVYARTNRNASVVQYYLMSPTGKKILSIFKKHKPMVPNKRRDYLIVLEIQKLLNTKAQQTKTGLITILALIFQMSNQQKVEQGVTTVIGRKETLDFYIANLNASQKEESTGLNAANSIVNAIEHEVTELCQKLPTKKLSKGYLTGFLWGDGGFSLGISRLKTGFFQLNPTLSFTEPNRTFLKAIRNTLGSGTIIPVGAIKGNCFQLRITSWRGLEEVVLPFFGNVKHPPYFLTRINKLAYCLSLQKRNLHLRAEGWTKIINTCYDMCDSEAHNRTWGSKEELISAGIASINLRQRAFKDALLVFLKQKHKKIKLKK